VSEAILRGKIKPALFKNALQNGERLLSSIDTKNAGRTTLIKPSSIFL
jgi:hypothetical protein